MERFYVINLLVCLLWVNSFFSSRTSKVYRVLESPCNVSLPQRKSLCPHTPVGLFDLDIDGTSSIIHYRHLFDSPYVPISGLTSR